ncbi:MAG TPA: DUF885 domain-containing protein [Gammaproteobacteria bacterium]|jgi:uncharacterized protein (DUF885 family)
MKTMALRLWLLLGLALAAGCGSDAPPSAPEQSAAPPATAADIERESARLTAWLNARYEEELAFSPIEKTLQGRKDDYDKLDDNSEAGLDEQLRWREGTVDELKSTFDYALLTPEAKISYDLWTYQLERAEAAQPFRRRAYQFTQRSGPHTQLPQFLINFHRVDEEADMTAYIARLGETARYLEQTLERAKLAAAEGVHAPRFAYEAVIMQARAIVTGAPFGGAGDAPLFADAKAKIDALVANGKIDAARAEELRTAFAAALTEQLMPAYDDVIAWVESDLPNTDEAPTGIWKLPQGREYYAERLAAMTTTEMTADEIHELGLREVARIQGEMEAIRQRVGFKGSLQELFAFVREDPQFFFPNNDEGREAYLQAARDYLGAIKQKLPDYFGLLPKADLIVKRVEPFREEPGAAQHYFGGTPDGSRPGIYYAHLIDMTSMPKWDMESVAYHEGLPGHHMQISIAQELTGIPKFRTQLGVTAYAEGWGLYAEALAKEMGGYEDPYSDLGRLGNEIWRAVRLVVDTGMHAKGWTEEQAVAYFMANAPTSEGQIRSEIQRYLVTPGQATAYKVGMLKIQELRAKAERELGARFDIRGFHDAVLGGGALPLSILERRVNDWIASQNPG